MDFSLLVAQSIHIVNTCKKEEERMKLKNLLGWAPEGSPRYLSQQQISHIERDFHKVVCILDSSGLVDLIQVKSGISLNECQI